MSAHSRGDRHPASVNELVSRLSASDTLVVVIDEERTAAYGSALGFSPCQIELLAADIDRFVRALTRAQLARQPKEKQECRSERYSVLQPRPVELTDYGGCATRRHPPWAPR